MQGIGRRIDLRMDTEAMCYQGHTTTGTRPYRPPQSPEFSIWYQVPTSTRGCMTPPSGLVQLGQMPRYGTSLGHLGRRGMILIHKSVVNFPYISLDEINKICEACIKGKHHRQPHRMNMYRSNRKLALIHSDLCGPIQVASISGSFYFITFIDDNTRHARVYMIPQKHATTVRDVFKEYKATVEGEIGKKILKLRTDNGKEYLG